MCIPIAVRLVVWRALRRTNQVSQAPLYARIVAPPLRGRAHRRKSPQGEPLGSAGRRDEQAITQFGQRVSVISGHRGFHFFQRRAPQWVQKVVASQHNQPRTQHQESAPRKHANYKHFLCFHSVHFFLSIAFIARAKLYPPPPQETYMCMHMEWVVRWMRPHELLSGR